CARPDDRSRGQRSTSVAHQPTRSQFRPARHRSEDRGRRRPAVFHQPHHPAASSGLLAIEAKTADGEGPWYSNNRITSHNTPIVVNDGSVARKRIESAFDEFREM